MKTPMKAIRAYCMQCTYGQVQEIRECPCTESCKIWDYRLGHRPSWEVTLTPMKAIRAKCISCSETLNEIRECRILDCALYPYRLGHRPPKEQ